MRAFARAVVRFFLTGVAVLLPFIVTVFVVTWSLKLADAYIGPSSHLGQLVVTIVGDSNKYPGYLVGYLVIVLLLILLGFLVTRATLSELRRAVDNMFARIPLIGKIYAAVGQVVELLGNKDNGGLERFGGVGIIELGNVKMLCLLTSGQRYRLKDGKEYLLVFLPNSPIPATGFNVLVPEDKFQPLQMPVEDMAKIFMSLGLLSPQLLTRFSLTEQGEDARHG